MQAYAREDCRWVKLVTPTRSCKDVLITNLFVLCNLTIAFEWGLVGIASLCMFELFVTDEAHLHSLVERASFSYIGCGHFLLSTVNGKASVVIPFFGRAICFSGCLLFSVTLIRTDLQPIDVQSCPHTSKTLPKWRGSTYLSNGIKCAFVHIRHTHIIIISKCSIFTSFTRTPLLHS